MKNIKASFLLSVIMLLFFQMIFSISANGQQIIQGSIPKAIAQLGLKPIKRLGAKQQLSFTIGLPLRNQKALEKRLRQIYDRNSPMYHHFQTVKQFTAEFGPTETDYQTMMSFCKANGLKITGTTKNRMVLEVRGTVGNIEKVLHVTMKRYQHPTESRTFFAPDKKPVLDTNIPILRISGLNNYYHTRPLLKKTFKSQHEVSNMVNGSMNGNYIGYDFRDAYAPGVTLTGTGQTVALLQFDGFNQSDITTYESKASLPNVPLDTVLLGGFSGNPIGYFNEKLEVCLDIEMAISMAPGLSRVMIYETQPDSGTYAAAWDYMLDRIASDNIAKQISSSWSSGGPADPVAEQIFMEMADQGQSFLQASGDSDAWTGLIPFPSDSPNITVVGGTDLTTTGPGGSYVSETVWNDNNGVGSGGGISTQYTIPSWQQGVDMSNNQGSTTMRNIPDVALTASNVYVYAMGQGNYDVQGTSIAAPLWAGFTSLINEQFANDGHSPIGFLNPALYYGIGESSDYTNCLHDITTGNNTSSASPNKFYAESGYDLCTGWGTPHGQALINALISTFFPATITSNTTLSGKYYRVDQNVHVENDATLTIPAGVHLFMGPNVEFIDSPGSKILANGTASNPVYMTGLGPNIVWNGVVLQGDGNGFNWTLFDGGHENVDVESDNNAFDNCTFQHGWRGISSYWNQSGDGGITYFSLYDCMIRDNSTVGVVVYNANAALTSTTIMDNGSAGIWFYNSNPSNIYYNAFTINDTDRGDYPDRAGLEVTGGSEVFLPYNAQNLIADNLTSQIIVYSDGTLSMGNSTYEEQGLNSVYGGY